MNIGEQRMSTMNSQRLKFSFLHLWLGIALMCTCHISCSTRSDKIIFIDDSPENIFLLAQKTHKKVFVLITDSTCGSCNHFIDFLNTQTTTKKILSRDYLCYNADIKTLSGHKIAEIVKCPAYPFPYFFDSNGNLLAFGFPNSKDYDITELKNIRLEEYRFTELFKLPISINAYKKLISINIRGTILEQQKHELDAYQMFRKSLDIAKYPYNIRHVQLLAGRLNLENDYFKKDPPKMVPNLSDKFLYGDVDSYMLLGRGNVQAYKTTDSAVDYYINGSTKELGVIKKGQLTRFSFSIKNISQKPLIIYKVSHPCDCIKLSWSTYPIPPNQSTIVKGLFRPYCDGQFNKEIFIHTNSSKMPMGIFTIKGTSL